MTRIRSNHLSLVGLGALVVAIAVVMPSTAMAKKHKPKVVSSVYSVTNNLSTNRLLVFDRYDNGKLKQRAALATGGKGSNQAAAGCGPNCPIIGTVNEVQTTPNGKLIFTVNPGSNTVSAFRKTSKGVKLAATRSSAGQIPVSVTVYGHRLYVLNAGNGTISGLSFTDKGKLTPIAGSTRPLPGGGMGAARQIQFDKTGKLLVVAELTTNTIVTFKVNANGTPQSAVANPSATPLPFGFEFDRKNRLFMTELTDADAHGTLSVYNLNGAGGFGSLGTIDVQGTAGHRPCWVVLSPDGKAAFAVNTGGPGGEATVSRFTVSSAGKVKLVALTPERAGEFARTDIMITKDGKFVYVLSPAVVGGNTSRIDGYRVRGTHLAFIGSTPSKGAIGQSGLAGR